LYICERVSAYWSKPSLIDPARDVIAYVRAATACAFSASAGHAEGLSVDAQRGSGREQPLRAVADDEAGAAADDVVGLRRVERLRPEARGAAEQHLVVPALQQDPHLRLGRDLRELRARVVAREDRLVADALQREAVGAVLAHADAVPEAGAADDEARGGMGRRSAGKDEQRHERDELAHPQGTLGGASSCGDSFRRGGHGRDPGSG
jgi:hypothetical protein